eukprot:TRINITY_DN20856_c0_g1_i1.p1 TRINITY_DN20856_c0_g1~~TRINITY_DN20856_c0_g1_i1.p1  ORF type:complete len:248 (+),score=36.87 TRINITY_DN20856_c0_g1_i1:22-765(+)
MMGWCPLVLARVFLVVAWCLPSASLRLLWATPLAVIDVVSSAGVREKLAPEVLGLYTVFPELHHDAATTGFTRNERFFQWQKANHLRRRKGQGCDTEYLAWLESPSYRWLVEALLGHATDFVRKASTSASGSSDFVEADLFVWASVHANGSYHMAHTHPGAVVSGVFYVSVPEAAGNLVFEDPRGPLPPFDNRFVHEPAEDQLVLFPSWLVHQVTPTAGESPRISISFNLAGEWEDTAELHLNPDDS